MDSKISPSRGDGYKERRRESSTWLMCTKNERGHWLIVQVLPAKGMDRSRVHYKNNV